MERNNDHDKSVGGEAHDGQPVVPREAGRLGQIDNVVILKASPLRVWSVLTDFTGHRSWKPFIQLAGEAVEGGEATYSFRIGGLEKPMTSQAGIVRVEKPVVFAWTAGVARMLLFEERYELANDPGGTRVRHSVRFSGLFSRPLMALMRRKIQTSLVHADQCLERYLRRLAAQPTAKPRPTPPNRAARRARKLR